MDIAKLGFEINSAPATKAASDLDKMTAAAGRAESGTEKMARKIEREMSEMNRSVQAATGFIKGFVGAFLSVQGLRAFATLADQAGQLRSRIQLVTGAGEKYLAVQQRIEQVARSSYKSVADISEVFINAAKPMQQLGMSTQQTLDLMEAFSVGLVVSGANAQASASAIYQFGQAMQTGVLRGQEFNTVLQTNSAFVDALEKSLGKSRAELVAMARDGKLTVKDLAGVASELDNLRESADSMPVTWEDAMTRMRDALMKFFDTVNTESGALQVLYAYLDLVGEALGLIGPHVAELIGLWAKQDGEQKKVAVSAEQIAYAMKTVVTGIVIAKNTIDVLIDGFVLAGRMAGVVAGAVVETFSRMGDALDNLVEAIKNPFDDFTVADAMRKNMAMASDIAGRALDALVEESDGFKDKFNKNVSDVADAFEFLEKPIREVDAATVDLTETTGAAVEVTGALADATKTAAAMKKLMAEATREAERAAKSAYRAESDLFALIEDQAAHLGGPAAQAALRYSRELAGIAEMEAAIMALGPMTIEQVNAVAKARTMAAELYQRELDGMDTEAKRVAEESARAWEDFAYGLADAVLDGSRGVKDYFKRLLDDLKRQIISSGLMNIFKSIFNVSGSAGGGFVSQLGAMFGGPTFGTILGAAGGASGGVGGSVLTSLATAISGGVSSGLMGLGGTLAGLGMGGLGGGLAWAGGSVAANGLLGGLGGSFMSGIGSLGAGNAMMGIGQMLPAIGAALAAAFAIDKISGGKLFGTSYKFDSADRTIDFSGEGVSGQDSLTEVRQRSLFRGRKWRTTNTALDAEIVGPLEEFWNAILDANSEIARTFGREVAIDVPASFKQAFDSAGKVTSEIGTILGRQYAETWEVFAQRITAENIIANIDGMLGTLVSAPIFGGGGGGGPPGRGGDSTIVASLGGAVPLDVQAQVGEASAIAERWRDSAEALLDGAQFLLLAATDIHTGTGLLGEGGTLTQITDLIEDLQGGGESLSATYARVAGSAALLDQALALSGVQIDGTREHIVRLATAITDAAGGLETATALWNSYFANFYSAGEMAAYTAEQLRTAAESAFSGAGLDITDYLDTGGMERFRAEFEAAMPTMSPEDIAAWLRAADALAAVTASARQIDAALADNAWQLYLDGLSETERATAELTRYYDDLRDSLIANAATAAQLAEVEEQRAIAMGRLLAAQAEAAARAEADYQRAVRDISDELDAARMSEFALTMRDIDRWTRATTASLNDAARAAGLQAAREEDLALVHEVAANRAARAIAALQAQAEALAAELYGTPLSRLDARIAELQEAESAASSAIGGFSGALSDAANAAAEAMGLLLGSYSPLRAVDKLPIAMDALRRGETDANTVLGIAQKVYGSGRAYNDIFYEVQRIAAQNAANANQGGGGNTVVAGESTVSREMQALIAERDALLAEQQAAQRFMQASNLAQMVADLSSARGEGFDAVAELLGFTLEQFAADLRFEGIEDLTDYLTALKTEQLGFAELFDTPTAGDLEIVDAIDGLRDAIHVPEADETAAQERAETLTTLRDVRDALRVIAERGVNANEDAATATERVAEGVERLAVILESDGGPAEAASRRRGE